MDRYTAQYDCLSFVSRGHQAPYLTMFIVDEAFMHWGDRWGFFTEIEISGSTDKNARL